MNSLLKKTVRTLSLGAFVFALAAPAMAALKKPAGPPVQTNGSGENGGIGVPGAPGTPPKPAISEER